MPNYAYNPTAVTSNFEVAPKGDYTITFGKPKAFVSKEQDGTVKNYGIRFPFVFESGEMTGKKGIFTAYLHNEGSQSMTKRFQMACLGYGGTSEEEKRFNVQDGLKDWGSFDPETGEVGEAWKQFEGSSVIASVDVQPNKNTSEPQQQFKSWRPLSSPTK